MFMITIGHLLGVALGIGTEMSIQVESTAVKALCIGGLVLYLEIQLIWSLKFGKILFWGMVDQTEKGLFTQCQFGYSFMAGFLVFAFINSIF